MDVATFRTHFPEFTSTTVYPTAIIQFWSGLAEQLLDKTRWGALWSTGVELYTAHNIAIQAADIKAAAAGGAPGQAMSLKSSKGVGPMSVGIDTGSTSIQGAGDYNLTSYGTRFKKLANIAGMGGVQLSGGPIS